MQVHILPKHPHIHTHTHTHTLQNKLKQPQYKVKQITSHKSHHYTSLAVLRKFSKSEKKNVEIAAFLGHTQHLSYLSIWSCLEIRMQDEVTI